MKRIIAVMIIAFYALLVSCTDCHSPYTCAPNCAVNCCEEYEGWY